MSTNFTLSSIRERLALQVFYNQRQDFIVTHLSSIYGYAKWDAVIISGGTEMVTEVKVRDWNSQTFSTWMLEEDKYNALMSLKSRAKRDITPVYVNVFNDGVALFNLNDITPTFSIRDSKQSVMAQDDKRKEKSVAMLPLSAATFYPFPVDFDKLNDDSEKYFEVVKPGVKYNKLFRNEKR